ncbi:ABC transporter ATP-binding protein/permease [Desulfosarcina sp. OttesenSCG-928-B08]|nr:ABC transporter ATP-binding protein/permease [Desulfosarcina sp. OttesenSCG-928-B08]
MILGMIVTGLMEMILAGTISLLGMVLANPESIQHIDIVMCLYNFFFHSQGGASPPLQMLLLILVLVTLASAAKNLSSAVLTYQQTNISYSIAWNIAMRAFANYLSAPFTWHIQQNTSDLNTYIIWRTNIGIYCQCAMVIISQFAITFLLMIGTFILAPRIAPLFFFSAGLTALLIYVFTKRKAQQCGEVMRRINISANKLSLSALQGIREVQIYNQQNSFRKAFNDHAPESIRTSIMQSIYLPLPSWVLETIGMLLLLLIVLVMVHFNTSFVEISGILTLMAAVSWRILPAVTKIAGNILQLKIYYAQVESVVEHAQLSVAHHVLEPHTTHEFCHSLELRNLSFRYPHAEQPALADISLSVQKGMMAGFVGASGAGKTTLVGLLTGLISPQSGEIVVDGIPVKPGPGYLRIGYVPQNPYIMDATLAENLAFSAYGQKPDLQRVIECCDMAAMDFLKDLPDGIHTILGERGVRLSGGQVQRVAIARAIYNYPDILVFDEATSALDGAAEAAIQNTILSLGKGMTIIIVAHRLVTVEPCDVLFWLKDGIIYRQGNTQKVLSDYKEFLRANPLQAC